ncbi:HlyD family secretion protein [Altererythrobacter litoralis]|uniref:HlyD family secretion protein n=1 Tax=Altererythrobacter litoralis TaxID=3113904 RepID=A0ABU7GAR9_9SPHN|nr:HlyD family secretion protein [Erythrobacteraceae bacterium 1XM1-14]
MADIDAQFETSNGTEPPAANEVNARPRRNWRRLALMLSVPFLLLVGAGIYWIGLIGKVSTDNAYVQADKVSVSAEVGGRIVETYVKEGDLVTAGQLLFRIDPEPYQLALDEAQADLALAQANVIALSNSSDLAGVDISAAREDIAFAQSRLERVSTLRDRGFSTKADFEAAEHAVTQAREGLRQAEAKQREARAKLATAPAVPGENPQVARARARIADAELALRRTEVRAPAPGQIAQADRLLVGQQVVANLPVVTLVKSDASYVEANFKETDLTDMREGQRAKVTLDAYPGLELKGKVTSIGAGTGSEFSVLPAQNATGNWVKVTQRVPVKIEIEGKSPRRLIAGLSADVTVYTADRDE